VWWPRVDKKTEGRKLEHIQRLACLHITGAIRTTPTKALEIIVGLEPLTIFIKQEAMLACYRIKVILSGLTLFVGTQRLTVSN